MPITNPAAARVLSLIGLCAICQHVKIVKSAKGSTFIMCNLAKTDSRFSKYPPLPVVHCIGYNKKNQDDEDTAD